MNVEHLQGERKRTRARKCGNDSKGRTIKIDFPKQTNCLMYNSDISPVTQRRVWSATNHRKWQSGLRWFYKQVQITLMNIREWGAAGGGAGLSIRGEKDSSEWAKSIKYSSSHFCTFSSTNDGWSLRGTLAGGRRRRQASGVLLCLCHNQRAPPCGLARGHGALVAARGLRNLHWVSEAPRHRNTTDGELRSEEPRGEVPQQNPRVEGRWKRMSPGSVTHLTPNRVGPDFVRFRLSRAS